MHLSKRIKKYRHSVFKLQSFFFYSTPNIKDWKPVLAEMTDEELKAIARVNQLDDAGILAKENLVPFVAIMEKYNPGSVGVVYEDHDPEVDLFEKPGGS